MGVVVFTNILVLLETVAIRLPEVDTEPLSDIMLDFLIEHDQEEPYLDFKETVDIAKGSSFPELAKDFLAFLNYGGGLILIGFRDKSRSPHEADKKYKRQYIPVGLSEDFHIDAADLQSKCNSFCVHPVTLEYKEFHRMFDNQDRKFAAIYVPPSTEIVKAAKSGTYVDTSGRKHSPFSVSDVLFRRGTQSVPGSKSEREFIAKRILDSQYQLSVLSGKPDRIRETVVSNIFGVSFKDRMIWVGTSRSFLNYQGVSGRIPKEFVSKKWGEMTVSFEDLSNPMNPLWNTVETSSIEVQSLDDWLNDEDRRRIVIALLNKELGFLARRKGLARFEKTWRYYYPCSSDSLSKTWKPKFKKGSELTVAKKTYIPKLKRDMFIHLAVHAVFTAVDNRTFLCLSPTLILTADGITPAFGEKEGAVLTSLLHNRYNQAYLNNVLFWIQQFADEDDKIGLAHGRVQVSARSVESVVPVGLLADRPVSERIPEIVQGESPR